MLAIVVVQLVLVAGIAALAHEQGNSHVKLSNTRKKNSTRALTSKEHKKFDKLLDQEHKASHDLIKLGVSDEDHSALHKNLDMKHRAFHKRLSESKSK